MGIWQFNSVLFCIHQPQVHSIGDWGKYISKIKVFIIIAFIMKMWNDKIQIKVHQTIMLCWLICCRICSKQQKNTHAIPFIWTYFRFRTMRTFGVLSPTTHHFSLSRRYFICFCVFIFSCFFFGDYSANFWHITFKQFLWII